MERTTFALRMGHINTLIAHCDRAESRFHAELAAVHGQATQATLAYTQQHKTDATTIGALQKQVELGLEDKVGWESERRELDAKVDRLEKDRDAQRDAVETAARLRLVRRREEDDIDRSLLDALNASSRSSSTDQSHIDNAPKPAGSLPDLPPLPPAPHHVSSDSDMDLESAPSRPLSPRVGSSSSTSRMSSLTTSEEPPTLYSPFRAPPVKRAAQDGPSASSPSMGWFSVESAAESVKKQRTDGLVFAASGGQGGKSV